MPGTSPTVHRLAAFAEQPGGGNPAGVVLSDDPLLDAGMQAIAADVGYSETAFLSGPADGRRAWQVRYFSPAAEVPFCGHATIAAGVLLGDLVGPGSFTLHARPGPVTVEVRGGAGRPTATLTSVSPTVGPASEDLLDEVLAACGLERPVLDDTYAAAVASAGARHLVLVLRSRAVLGAISYEFERVRRRMLRDDLTTIAFLWPDPSADAAAPVWHARNLFPVGGVVEDPATGAAAAAFGAYLRSTGAVTAPTSFEIRQGEDLGRPSRLHVHVPDGDAGIQVTGTAVEL
jgi:PhzF family phenazine biosynthesis protein